MKDLLVAPKDRDSMTNKGGVIYRYKCDHPGWTMDYIGETSMNYGDSYREHLRAPSPIYNHVNTTGYTIKLDNFSTVDRESQGIIRTIKEAMCVHQSQWLPSTDTLASTSCLTSGMGYCRICQLSVYSDTYLFHPSTVSPESLSIKGGMHASSGKYGPLRSASPPSLLLLFPHVHIGTKFFCHILVPKLVSITFSLRPEEALLELTLWKLVCIQMHILLCYIALSLS